jgi:pyruvate/2-oxoglutarate dehydrogenase complex dihydrolipoamide dehydrogenase (E3) component
MNRSFDAIVIGAGQSGPFLAARFAEAGMKVALIEREHLGGTCVNDGCIPTKTLVASARAAHVVRGAAAHGVHTAIDGEVRVDMREVKARKDAVVAQSIDGLTSWLGGMSNLTLFRGHARFVAPDRVRAEVDGVEREMQAPKIFIDVGGRATVPDWPGIEGVPYLTNSSMMSVDFLPRHLVIVGGSYIGLEFAQMYRRFGSEVSVIEASPRLIGREDAEVSAEVRAILEREGVAMHCGAKNLEMAGHQGGVKVDFDIGEGNDASSESIVGSHLLLAVGRKPNTDDLGLNEAGILTDSRGYIVVDDELRTSVAGVWAMGDVNGRGAFTHTSYNDFEIVAANLLDGGKRRVSDRIGTYALYIDPPLGRIGMSEAEVRASGRAALVATLPMTRVGRARERGETDGFMKVLVDAQTQRILGAALLGIEADEVVQQLLLAMAADLPYTRIQLTMGIHPTVSELLPTLFGGLKPLA